MRHMEPHGNEFLTHDYINILGLQISSSLSWRDHIVQIASQPPNKYLDLCWCKQYFNSTQLFKLYTGFFRPCLGYCSHIWGTSPFTSLLYRVEIKAIRLIGDLSLTSTPDTISSLQGDFSVFFYHYCFGHCSDELAACILPPMDQQCSTHQASFAHNYCVELSNERTNWFSDGFFPFTSTCGTLSHLLFFWLPSTFLQKASLSST